jgi:RNA polymerase sigma-70 factor (ECF subfamily)
MNEQQETDTINRVLDGEMDAFALLVDAYQGLLLRVIAGILNEQRHLAEEVTQDVLVEAFRKLPDFDPARSPFRSWLLMIARSRAINALRKKRPTYLAVVPETAQMPSEPMKDEWRLLDQALHQLPAKQKRALLLAQVEGLPYRQIAEIEGTSVGTIKSRVSRAREFLRSTLSLTQ